MSAPGPGAGAVRVLAADIGGTKTWMQLAEVSRGGCRVLAEQRYDSLAYPDFLPLAMHFLDLTHEHGPIERACLAVAGPVQEGMASVTNLPWVLAADTLAQALSIRVLRLINDFQAVGYGIEALTADDVAELQPGHPVPGAPVAVIGAGTGLGQGILIWERDHYEPLPTEGGHADFAPTDAQQIALLSHLMAQYGHVSYERVVSGPGLVNIYNFLRQSLPERESPVQREVLQAADPAAAISQAALDGSDALAAEALELFVRIYGAQAGNLALACLPFGGLYVAGGIAPKVLERLQSGVFMASFRAKGRMSTLLTGVPVRVVLNPRVGLLGAAMAASRL